MLKHLPKTTHCPNMNMKLATLWMGRPVGIVRSPPPHHKAPHGPSMDIILDITLMARLARIICSLPQPQRHKAMHGPS
jgi:hypothetical protein